MNLEDLVPLLKTCQRLKELGWNKETALKRWESIIVFGKGMAMGQGVFYAPTASELGKVLPLEVDGYSLYLSKDEDYWYAEYRRNEIKHTWLQFKHEKMSESMAQLLIFLIENKHLEL